MPADANGLAFGRTPSRVLNIVYLPPVAEGHTPGDPDAGDPVLAELAGLKDALTALTSRIDAIEQQLADGGERP